MKSFQKCHREETALPESGQAGEVIIVGELDKGRHGSQLPSEHLGSSLCRIHRLDYKAPHSSNILGSSGFITVTQSSAGDSTRQPEFLLTASRNINWYSSPGNEFNSSLSNRTSICTGPSNCSLERLSQEKKRKRMFTPKPVYKCSQPLYSQ